MWGKNLYAPQKLYTIVVKMVHFSEKNLSSEVLFQIDVYPIFCYRNFNIQNSDS